MREWYLSSELVGLRGMANSLTGVTQKAKRNNWLSRKSMSGNRALEYHISNFHPDVKKQLIEKYVTDPKEAMLLMALDVPIQNLVVDADGGQSIVSKMMSRLVAEDDGTAIYKQEKNNALTQILSVLGNHSFSDDEKELFKRIEAKSRAIIGADEPEILDGSIELNLENKDVSYVTYYDITASAGAGRLIEYVPNKRVELSETLRLALNIQTPSRAKLLNMEGDSMHPTLKDKSILAIEELETFKQDGVYVFTFDNTLYVKRLQKSREGIKVISDNPIYDAWFINRDEVDTPMFTIHGRVTGCAQSV
ncbi:hypothetical protein SD340_004299 [Vibrio fluvialis]|uniref:helix-turn-helix domain-containing protein n=1 Tax=Vibrio fluvialis TaxID=676 RepID=UPI0013025046|nr:S24 family peptidase [Vibrio fluvialis]EKO3414929.1 hypothetical protein [Vibrio fluvialis]EKO3524404.1 hypothetical protein [Vibrio fluvialis]EKO3528649.1 hypothetical protein [Vibrio fluvialis]ELC0660914.1 hypothetical protein [Vibrio fluvialis]ELO1814328.1 hypothetical protein [Vibrio fluvialis]